MRGGSIYPAWEPIVGEPPDGSALVSNPSGPSCSDERYVRTPSLADVANKDFLPCYNFAVF
eukprot:2907570-Pyramimonas_sp.AAC.1